MAVRLVLTFLRNWPIFSGSHSSLGQVTVKVSP